MRTKHLLLIAFLLNSITIFAQIKAKAENGKDVILNTNGTWKYASGGTEQKISLPDFKDKSFNWTDGYDKIVSVKFKNLLGDKTMDKPLFDNIVINSLTKAQYKLKNKLSFVPKELSVMIDKDNEYIIQVNYLGKNSYNAESEMRTIFMYDSTGKLTGSF
jgi:hypothetical protein